MQHNVLILDFGSQYTQLIARRVRELNIFCEIFPYNKVPEDLSSFKATILSGSPFSVRADDAPHPDLSQIRGKMPLLAVCYGAQYLAHFDGGEVAPSNIREYGRANLSFVDDHDPFFEEVALNSQVWMSHSDTIKKLPTNGVKLASTKDVENAAYRIEGEKTYAIQFHPEVYHSTDGKQMLENFLVRIAEVPQNFTPNAFVEEIVAELQEKIKGDKVVLGLSGGVDSSVTAYLLQQQGHEVVALFMRNWNDASVTLEDECPWIEDSNDALMVAQKLGIPFQVIDMSDLYKERIVDYMFDEYQKGRTPNPDVLCNREVKFDVFLETALSLGADKVATGHYARLDSFTNEKGDGLKLPPKKVITSKMETEEEGSEVLYSQTDTPCGDVGALARSAHTSGSETKDI